MQSFLSFDCILMPSGAKPVRCVSGNDISVDTQKRCYRFTVVLFRESDVSNDSWTLILNSFSSVIASINTDADA